MTMNGRPELVELHVADPPDRWEALGFQVAGGACDVGAVRLRLDEPGAGITAWSLRGVNGAKSIDGLTTRPAAPPASDAVFHSTHPNRASGLDTVVVTTPDFDRTSTALGHAGLPLRSIREAGGDGNGQPFRQGFRRLGPAILELVEVHGEPDGPARFWGLVVIVNDLGELADRLGDQLGAIHPAVQPGRQIATLRPTAGLSPAVAFMDPDVMGLSV
jgi:hypothetical protein